MAAQDTAGPASRAGGWWPGYLEAYFAACGVPADQCPALAEQAAAATTRGLWTYVSDETRAGLRALAALGVPMGVVSNSDGRLQAALARLGLCYVPGPDTEPSGIPVGVVVDSAQAGVAKPDPAIFGVALDALGVPASAGVLHVGDSLRSDVEGALAAAFAPSTWIRTDPARPRTGMITPPPWPRWPRPWPGPDRGLNTCRRASELVAAPVTYYWRQPPPSKAR